MFLYEAVATLDVKGCIVFASLLLVVFYVLYVVSCLVL
jgi:hypothetical protein